MKVPVENVVQNEQQRKEDEGESVQRSRLVSFQPLSDLAVLRVVQLLPYLVNIVPIDHCDSSIRAQFILSEMKMQNLFPMLTYYFCIASRERTAAYSPIAPTMKKMQVSINWSRQVSTPLAGVPLKRLMQTSRRMTSSDIRPGTI